MRDRRQLRPPLTMPASSTDAAAPKRTRKLNVRNTDDEKQRERKRALDRKAQRASREKTRSHIAHLEKMVQILSDKNGNAGIIELMDEMTRLHAEIDRLRKIIDSIKSVLGTDIFEPTIPSVPYRQASQSPDNEQNSTPRSPNANEIKFTEANLPQEYYPTPRALVEDRRRGGNSINGDMNDDMNVDMEDLEERATTVEEVGEGQPGNPQDSDSNSSNRDAIDWSTGNEEDFIIGNRWSEHESKVYKHTPFWNLPNPLRTAMPEPPVPDFIPCKIWQTANSIYGSIFVYPRERILSANNVDPGSLFKAIKEGWGSLSLKERSNPVLQILKDVEQNLFWDLDPVTKVATLYKSMLLLKYYFNTESKNLERMPLWQRPIHTHKTRRHPITIDFFPWPSLRDRLIRHHNYYFATSDFSVAYRQHFKFSWPFRFEDTYRYDPPSAGRPGTYRISPLFERYYREERCWALEEVFFQRYPEFIGEMSVHRAAETEEVDVSFDLGAGSGMEGSWSFADAMEMFNDYPPT
ncbi:hypothetical protein B0O99DRAFT_616187 [Bisporella sp. PMI_857]|nr:hypothetical protein B0O99DRAFT_616187 [Bisporella sp. PMI_857]